MRPTLDVPIALYVDTAAPGGTAVYTVNLAYSLCRAGYRVGVICSGGPDGQEMREQLVRVGVQVHALDEQDRTIRGRVRRVLEFRSILRRYRRGVLCLLLGNYVSGGPLMLAGRVAGMGAIVRADLQPPMPPFSWWKHGAAIRLKDLLVDRIVVGALDNQNAFALHTRRTASKMTIIHTGVDLTPLEPGTGREDVRQELGYSCGTLVVGAISRLDEERKGMAQFIEMAAIVGAAVPQAAFLVVGNGPLQPVLENQAESLGIGDRTTFAGWRGDLARVLAALDVFVMPSLYEGGPTIVLEAMAMAKPIVATRVGMVPEVVDPGETGLVVDPGDAGELAAAVSRLLADKPLRTRIAQAARERAVRDFSRERMAQRYLEVFASCLSATTR